MNTLQLIGTIIIVLVIACVWLLIEKLKFQTKILDLKENLEEVEVDLARAQSELEKKNTENQTLSTELAVSENTIANEEGKIADMKRSFQEQKDSLKAEFESLSEKILKERQKDLQSTNTEGLAAILNPLKAEISGFKDRVEKVHSESQTGQGALKQQLESLKSMNSNLSERADNLSKALRNDKKTLGNWGEVQLERILENSGLGKEIYRREANFKTDEGANQRPDFIIDLPDNKTLIIDSKVSLNAYVDSVSAETPEEALSYLKQHTTNIRNHIKSLGEKSYISLPGVNSPDFVFMFMPTESAYIAAVQEDASLLDFAYEKQVALVTTSTLLPILKTVESLWRLQKQNSGTEALAQSGALLHKKLITFLEKFVDIEKKLESLQGSFVTAKNTLTDGKGNLVKMAGEFEEKGVKVLKPVPDSLIE